MRRWRSLRRAVSVALFAPLIGWNTATPTLPLPAGDADVVASSLRQEVRLRKLHLVRPDLIGYPIAFEVYC